MSKSPALRRIQADVRELKFNPSPRYFAAPLEDDMFEWHFTIRGPRDTEFEGGVYHGRILVSYMYVCVCWCFIYVLSKSILSSVNCVSAHLHWCVS